MLERGLNHNAGTLRRPFDGFASGYTIGHRLILAKQIADLAQPLRQRLPRHGSGILDAYFVTSRRKQIGNAVAHEAGADHCNARLFHAG